MQTELPTLAEVVERLNGFVGTGRRPTAVLLSELAWRGICREAEACGAQVPGSPPTTLLGYLVEVQSNDFHGVAIAYEGGDRQTLWP